MYAIRSYYEEDVHRNRSRQFPDRTFIHAHTVITSYSIHYTKLYDDTTSTLNTLEAPYVEASVSGNSITADSNAGSETLSAYSSAQTFDGRVAPAPYTMSASGTLDSTQIGGVVDYSTPVTFEGVDTGYPTAGILLVEGADSAARLT